MRVALIVVAVLAVSGPAWAQSDSTMCHVFPLACPGPVPPKPAPLLGPPEDQAAAEPAEQAPAPHKHHVRKRVAKAKAQ